MIEHHRLWLFGGGGGFPFHLLGKKIPILKPRQVCMKAGDQAVCKHDPMCYRGVLKSAMMNSRRTKCRESTFLNFVIQWSPSSTLSSVLCRPSFVLHHLRFLLLSWWVSAGLKWSRAGGTYARLCFLMGSLHTEWKGGDCKERVGRGTGGRSHWFKFTFTCQSDNTTLDSARLKSAQRGAAFLHVCARSPRKYIRCAELGFGYHCNH